MPARQPPGADLGLPQLLGRAQHRQRLTLTYRLPGRAQAFALDSFPEQLHAPITDHADFANVMPDNLMRFAVTCINSGRNC
ncbi:hypothetical protein [Thermomonospora sp. CIF 1]|uniref:hypothetical protein n=1 Tax=Thermomonospora sp. CIF 1 TaxID=1916083 RepID=UPI00257EC524|nr:hypothetical protein [Thermomonospora sp. CIF 1]